MTPSRTGTKSSVQHYRKTTLRNGLRVLTEKIPSVRSISLGVWIDVGSRYEAPDENGVSHLIEHMLFKGTRRRTARQIADALESIGGHINAFTSREQTCYNVRVLDEYLDLAVDVLSDMTCHSTLTPTNLRREKQVVLEEIKEAFDAPADRIHDLFSDVYWNGGALGQPILGTSETVFGLSRARVLRYLRQHYRTGSIIIAAAGNISHRRLVELVRQRFSFDEGPPNQFSRSERPNGRSVKFVGAGNSQTHLCLGFPSVSYDSAERVAVLAVNNYLGGGMSSVLFQKIREDLGLAYSVYTYADMYRDSGIFGAYAGTDKRHVADALAIILRELERMKKRRLPRAVVDKIKAQLKGHIMLGMESTTARMNRLARQELMLGRFQPFDETLARIEALTPSDLLEFANRSFDRSQLTVVTLGPVDRRAMRNVIEG